MIVSGVAALLAIPSVAAAAPSDVVLNEVNCAGTDWVELLNRGGAEVSLAHWLLTDDPLGAPARNSHRMRFGDDVVLAPGARLVVTQGDDGFPFGLACGDDTLRLADGSDTLVDEFALPALTADGTTYGRVPDGSGGWRVTTPTQGAANAIAPDGQPADPSWLYDPLRVTQIDLTVEAGLLPELDNNQNDYVDGRITIRNGTSTYGPYRVGVELKGRSSFRRLSGKAAFKVKFGYTVSGQRFQGLKELTLNNMVQDPSMIAEATASLLIQATGTPTARVGYAYVRVNGADYGLYSNVETVDSVMARRWFTTTQHVYKANYATDVGPGRSAEFEVEDGPSKDRSDLEELSAADAGDAAGWWERMQPVTDLAEMTRAWALEHYLGHWDGYSVAADVNQPNNYYLNSDSGGRFALIPSGTDQTWVERSAFGVYGNGVLMRHCIADDACRQLYVDALRQLALSPALALLPAQARAIRAVIAPWRERDPRREQSIAEGEADAQRKIAMMAARPAELAEWLASPSFVEPLPPPEPESGGG